MEEAAEGVGRARSNYVLNRTTLIGFTGQEPETFATQSGKEITRLPVATTGPYQQASEWKEKTQWHDCVVLDGAAQTRPI